MLKNIFLILALILSVFGLLNCTSNGGPYKETSCKINDTLIKGLTFNTNSNEFKSFLALPENKTLEANGIKLNCKYTPHFYSDKLYSIEIELMQSDSIENLTHSGEINNEIESKGAYRKLLDMYISKYGNPTKLVETGKKGEWKKEYSGALILEHGEFEIHRLYVWLCNSKRIKIEFDVLASLTDITWNSNATEDEIVSNKNYLEKYFDNFKIIYSDLKVEEQVNQETAKRGMQNYRKNDSIQRVKDKKLKEDI